MTINICWLSETSTGPALSVISDSRLTGSFVFDECTKIFRLPRGDCFISFAGSTEIAYTVINQAINAVMSNKQSQDRYQDVTELKGHLLNVISKTISELYLHTETDDADLKDIEFIFGGYSWKTSEFRAWRIRSGSRQYPTHNIKNTKCEHVGFYHPDPLLSQFVADRKEFTGRHLIITGTKEEKDKLEKFLIYKRRLNNLDEWGNLPVEVLRDFLMGKDINLTSGGPMQFVRVFSNMKTEQRAVFWPDKNGVWKPTVSGRFLLGYENFDTPLYDPLTLDVVSVPYRKNSRNNDASLYEDLQKDMLHKNYKENLMSFDINYKEFYKANFSDPD